jgi:Restriction Endonuclease associating with ARP
LISYAFQLRQDVIARNLAYARCCGLPHVCGYGESEVVVYEPSGEKHGNFLNASYRAIRRNPDWARRLDKVHTSAGDCLPRAGHRWRELDSCTSSDALLMNVFCHPRTLEKPALCSTLKVQVGESPLFGFRARVPLANGRADRTEVDMKLGSLLVESKLTESGFQTKAVEAVESYRDLHQVFDSNLLPRERGQYVSYQLIRNVLAAYALGLSLCVLLDARRPDLIEAWYAIMKCVKTSDLRTRCQVLTWQELSQTLPGPLQRFLEDKYGIERWRSLAMRCRQGR